MRLNHIGIHVPDVAATRDFLCRHFGVKDVGERGNSGLAILHDDAGLEIVLTPPIARYGGDIITAGANTYHIGFFQNTREDVDTLFATLSAAGAEMGKTPHAVRGDWLFYCFAPGRIMIEVAWRSGT